MLSSISNVNGGDKNLQEIDDEEDDGDDDIIESSSFVQKIEKRLQNLPSGGSGGSSSGSSSGGSTSGSGGSSGGSIKHEKPKPASERILKYCFEPQGYNYLIENVKYPTITDNYTDIKPSIAKCEPYSSIMNRFPKLYNKFTNKVLNFINHFEMKEIKPLDSQHVKKIIKKIFTEIDMKGKDEFVAYVEKQNFNINFALKISTK